MSRQIIEKIERLKKEKNAVLLVHNYQPAEVQDVADFLGDSLGLSQQAAITEADIIVFCGVNFMAETAVLLSPDKKVLIPDPGAGCPMANMIDPKGLEKLKQEHPGAAVVTYVNSTAETKALSDVCCTSANAVKVVRSIPNDKVIFVPDQYLGSFVAKQVDKEMILWKGYCPTHVKIQPEHIVEKREKYPGALVMVHPECTPGVIEEADEALSTEGMSRLAKATKARTIIVGTEVEMICRLKKENPEKTFVPALEQAVCPNMKKNSLEKVLWALEEEHYMVTVAEDIAGPAREAITKMLEYSR